MKKQLPLSSIFVLISQSGFSWDFLLSNAWKLSKLKCHSCKTYLWPAFSKFQSKSVRYLQRKSFFKSKQEGNPCWDFDKSHVMKLGLPQVVSCAQNTCELCLSCFSFWIIPGKWQGQLQEKVWNICLDLSPQLRKFFIAWQCFVFLEKLFWWN